MNSREAAYLAILNFLKDEKFLSHSLDEWQRKDSPNARDFALAKEIAYGTVRRMLSLEYLAGQLCTKKLKIKKKEKALLYSALYQRYFMKIPKHAIGAETALIAKKYLSLHSVSFLNAIIRNASELILPDSLSIKFSFPEFVARQLDEKTLAALNKPGKTVYRIRNKFPPEFKILEGREKLKEIASSRKYYIQNFTPAHLMYELCPKSKSILDLCASPGGKTILAHELFPEAKLYANDISEKKLEKLKENFAKYEMNVELSCCRGEEFTSKEKFDLIIIDAPCSNSGVLNKRPEARWRITKESLKKLTKTQLKLIENAKKLLSPGGKILYLTCSIFKHENEDLMQKTGMKIEKEIKILPKDNWDGGFGALLS